MNNNRKASLLVIVLLLIVPLVPFTSSCTGNEESTPAKEDEHPSQVETPVPDMDLHTAVLMGNVKAVKQHILAGSDLDVREPSVGSSPLITAAVFGKTEPAKLLIKAGADVNFTNNEGSTPLHMAAFFCRTEIVEMLLQHGADKSRQNQYGSTPLQSVAGPFEDVRPIYDVLSRDLGPLGLKLDYDRLKKTRPVIADMLR